MWQRRRFFPRRRSVRTRTNGWRRFAAQLSVETLENRLALSVNNGLASADVFRFVDMLDQTGSWPHTIDAHVAHFGSDHHHHDQDLVVDTFEEEHDHSGVLTALGDLALEVGGQVIAAALHPLTSIPLLNSLPSAAASLFLDFDGHFEAAWGIYTNITASVFDNDGDATTFSDDELAFISDTWARVAEDFAPFNINVTTVEPAVLASGVPANQANGVAMRIAVGPATGDNGFGGTSGGIAYINSFTSSIPNVAWAFSHHNPSGSASIASHEAGHAFGLQHQTTYDQQGNVITGLVGNPPPTDSWFPIMQSALVSNLSVTTWHHRPTVLGPTSIQDDMAVIAGATNGFGFRPDDHGNTAGSATPLAFDGTTFSGTGIIGANNDVDVWSFTIAEERTVRLTLDAATLGPNLDAVLELRNSAGVVVASDSPRGEQGAEVIATLPAGAYTVHVSKENVYGWLGEYTLSGVSVAPSPRVVATDPADFVGQASLANIRVTFAEAIDPASFDTSDVVLSGPFGPIAVTGVNVVAGSGDRQFDVTFPAQTTFAQYQVVVGPDIRNPSGSLMNQDVDTQFGEVLEDQFQTIIQYGAKGPAWATALGSAESRYIDGDHVYDMAGDAAGNSYVTGDFTGTATFGEFQLTSTSKYKEAFVAKLNADGNVLWAQRMGGADYDYGRSIAVDATGNVYVLGTFQGTGDFGATQLTSEGTTNVFLAKLDASGNFLWARRLGGTASYAIDVDSTGNVLAVGAFSGTAQFGGQALTSAGGTDLFVSKLDGAGNFLWTIQLSGAASVSTDAGLSVDSAGDIFVSGSFSGMATFGNQSFDSGNGHDGFVARLSGTNGSFLWTKQFTGDENIRAMALDLDDAGGLYVTGYHLGAATFGEPGDMGFTTLTAAGENDAYIARLNAATGEVEWAYGYGGASRELAREVFVDAAGDIYFTGRSSTTADYRGTSLTAEGSNNLNVLSVPDGDAFILKVNSAGDFLAGWMLGDGVATEEAQNVFVDAAGNLYVGGWIGPASALTPGVLTGHEGATDGFVMKLPMAAGIRVSPITELVTSESGTTAQFSVVLETQPFADVTIPVSSSNPSEGTAGASTLTFTPLNWNVPQLVTVTGVDDLVIDGDVLYTVTVGAATSADPDYHGIDPSNVSLTNLDNDAPVIVFTDGFEVSEWNGLWVEDSQNDWFRSTQRATDGVRSAEVDGSATNATLTMSTSLDLSGYTSAELKFDWLIESGFDSGEYLALDVFNGTSWINDVRRLNGNSSAENTWHMEVVDLSPHMSASTQVRFRARASTSDEDGNVDNVRITAIPAGPNQLPIAEAGGPYFMNEGGSVTLSGAGSFDGDGTIDSYAWDLDGDGQYDDATGVTTSFSTNHDGVFTVGLRVTDNRGDFSTDSATVTVANVAPTASAGGPYAGFVGQNVALSAAGSTDPGGDIASYAWDLDGDGEYDDASGASVVFNTPAPGSYPVSVRVTDDDGASSTASTTVEITEAPSEVVVFEDSFEVGEWNGQWVEDSQNDWFRSAQRATHGSRSAEVDGSATNATLTMSAPVNLSSYASAELTFDWLIESGFDTGEYVALDVFNGSVWVNDVLRLNGNSSAENTWHQATVDLTPYLSGSTRIRFRANVSASDEDANVDNVRIVASGSSGSAVVVVANEVADETESVPVAARQQRAIERIARRMVFAAMG